MLKIDCLLVIIGGTQIITKTRKNAYFYKIIHFSMQFAAIVKFNLILLLQMS